MTTEQRYESAREIYKNIGVDTDRAVETLKNIHISMHCWQGMMCRDLTMKGHYPAVSRQQATTRERQLHPRNLWMTLTRR